MSIKARRSPSAFLRLSVLPPLPLLLPSGAFLHASFDANRFSYQAMGMSGPTIILGSDVLKLGKGAMIVSFVSKKIWLAL